MEANVILAILTTRTIVKKAMSPDFDPECQRFLYGDGDRWPCVGSARYNKFPPIGADDLGFSNAPRVLIRDQGENYGKDNKNLGTHFPQAGMERHCVHRSPAKLRSGDETPRMNKGEADAKWRTL